MLNSKQRAYLRSLANTMKPITQIGKECHSHCEIHKKMGTCIMPTNGIFAKVIKGGTIKAGDEIVIKGEK